MHSDMFRGFFTAIMVFVAVAALIGFGLGAWIF
jgi:type IV secretory pathway TrbD component